MRLGDFYAGDKEGVCEPQSTLLALCGHQVEEVLGLIQNDLKPLNQPPVLDALVADWCELRRSHEDIEVAGAALEAALQVRKSLDPRHLPAIMAGNNPVGETSLVIGPEIPASVLGGTYGPEWEDDEPMRLLSALNQLAVDVAKIIAEDS